MATLYVENVPDELYNALRERARERRKSVAAEVISLLEENVVTSVERRSRRQFLRQAQRLRSQSPIAEGPFASAEEIQREDRAR